MKNDCGIMTVALSSLWITSPWETSKLYLQQKKLDIHSPDLLVDKLGLWSMETLVVQFDLSFQQLGNYVNIRDYYRKSCLSF